MPRVACLALIEKYVEQNSVLPKGLMKDAGTGQGQMSVLVKGALCSMQGTECVFRFAAECVNLVWCLLFLDLEQLFSGSFRWDEWSLFISFSG